MDDKRALKEKSENNNPTTIVNTVELSSTKTINLEKDFRLTVESTRMSYLSEELSKYKDIQVSYD